MPIFLQEVLKIAFLFIVILALMGAKDYIFESVRIFRRALKNFRERNRD